MILLYGLLKKYKEESVNEIIVKFNNSIDLEPSINQLKKKIEKMIKNRNDIRNKVNKTLKIKLNI